MTTMNPTIEKLIETYGSIAWEAALRQVEVMADVNLVLAIISTVVLAASIVAFGWSVLEEWEGLGVTSGFVAIISLIGGIAFWTEWYLLSANPTYYAIKALLP